MARGARASPAGISTSVLPKVSYSKTEEEYTLKLFGVHNLQARSYGFNDFSQFKRPKYYIQHIEPIESDLARQVEYDMDEQDQEWLDAVNAERKKEQIDTVSYETFEIIMDRLEKEWFDLTKNIPKADFAMPSEDSTCAICDDSEGENSNAIVFCDGCNLAVHQDCYGVPYIPEGQWLCRKCTVSPEFPVSCILCPNEGGAFKQTVTGDWVHLLCAIWVPETRVANEVFMEPITGVDKISKQRWKLKCNICEIKEGACIQCAKASCFTAFHATCARKEKLLMPMKSTQGTEPLVLTCYCERHLPKEHQDTRLAALAAEQAAEEMENDENDMKSSKSARAYAKSYKPGPPLVPALIINRILSYIAKVQLRKRQEFVQMMARYWSLKREARRGAPLLKRLHLEPWTANGSSAQSDDQRLKKLEYLTQLREDLEKVWEITELTRKREIRKRAQARIIRDTLLSFLTPFEDLLRDSFHRIIAVDRSEHFRYPVSKAEVPDYFDIVKKPMCWSTIEEKINSHAYFESQEFKNDITLVLDNAMLYNAPNTAYFKTAKRVQVAAQTIFDDIDRVLAERKAEMEGRQRADNTDANGVNGGSGFPTQLQSQIGDLEPPVGFLELLASADAIKDDIDLLLEKEPLESLFSFELPKVKPRPPPPPPPPPKQTKSTKPKRDRKADLERKKREREAEAAARALEAQYYGEPTGRTRRAVASVVVETGALKISPPPIVEIQEAKPLTPPVPSSAVEEQAVPEVELPPAAPPPVVEVKRALPRKRASTSGMVEVPPMVKGVDNRGSFKMFDQGWIFPPEQRRGGRPPLERLPLPPPRKRIKTSKDAMSRLSVVSTSASDNQTLQQMSPVEVMSPVSVVQRSQIEAPVMEMMEVDTSALRTTISEEILVAPPVVSETLPTAVASASEFVALAPPSFVVNATPPPSIPVSPVVPSISGPELPFSNDLKRIVHGPDGTIIVEELDTPLIRRHKALRRREERRRMLEEQRRQQEGQYRAATSAVMANKEGDTGLIRLAPGRGNADGESDLSSLSDVGSEVVEAQGQGVAPSTPSAPLSQGPKNGELSRRASMVMTTGIPDDLGVIREDQLLEGGTLVWAKASTYPWWPAVIFEEDDISIPLKVKGKCLAQAKKATKHYMVRFFDKGKTWAYLPSDRLKMLGEFPELDEELLSAHSTKQRWKNNSSRLDCNNAFKLKAMAEMETTSDAALYEALREQALQEESGVLTAEGVTVEGDLSVATAAGDNQGLGTVLVLDAEAEPETQQETETGRNREYVTNVSDHDGLHNSHIDGSLVYPLEIADSADSDVYKNELAQGQRALEGVKLDVETNPSDS
ncbi:hypothetical protein AMATHDRAFT_159553 [Amanita thiersii Skay4041]|uniref:Histone acetyltransferase n=1 Tax=Amanita thiersii Skay4041 TaxID=703135 RepID=A0A2A9N6R7_9AGAR|nr:hypothetical protein AMATHDRAFT_159553 [Amanita thiersii Skay4041]